MSRLLLIEDNRELSAALVEALELEGHDVDCAFDGVEGTNAVIGGQYELVVLDVSLPERDGFRVLRTVRDKGVMAPVLILTARAEEDDKLRGFRLGADDYLTKPFGVRELLARVDALLRRRRIDGATLQPQHPIADCSSLVRFGKIEVNRKAQSVHLRAVRVALSPREFQLLIALIDRAGEVVARSELLHSIWRYESGTSTRTVDIHVVQLRRKLELNPSERPNIVTVRKVGYRFDP